MGVMRPEKNNNQYQWSKSREFNEFIYVSFVHTRIEFIKEPNFRLTKTLLKEDIWFQLKKQEGEVFLRTLSLGSILDYEFINQSITLLRLTMLKTKNHSSLNTPYPISIPRTFVPSVQDFLIQTLTRNMAIGSSLSFPGKNDAKPIFFFSSRIYKTLSHRSECVSSVFLDGKIADCCVC